MARQKGISLVNPIPPNLSKQVSKAVAVFWATRDKQAAKQKESGRSDQGARGAVTGGGQMQGFIDLVTELILAAGIQKDCIHYDSRLELPGFFRPTKEWDLLVIQNGQLLVALEAKSQVGSFGNNFNNRTEEAMGTALDLATAYREGAFNKKSSAPWLGYIFLLEDCPRSTRPVKVEEPHFKVFPEFRGASYMKRYELFCRKLLRERHYSAAAFLTSKASEAKNGLYEEPATDLNFELFARSLFAHVAAYAEPRKKNS